MITGPGYAASTFTATPKSASLRSISREVNSSVSALTNSCDEGASSSNASGGRGESGKSWNSGFCFSLTTRSDFGNFEHLRHDDHRFALVARLARRFDELLARFERDRAEFAVASRLAAAAPPRDDAFDARADALHQFQPRHAGKQRPARREQRDEQQRRAIEAERPRESVTDQIAQRTTGRVRQIDRQAIEPQSFE